MRVVLDTNVLVSGIWNSHGSPGQIVDLLLDDTFTLLYDDRIFDEYQDVLTRPKFHFPSETIEVLLEAVQANGERVVAHPYSGALIDPDDRAFLEVALSGHADALVTGNEKHYPVSVRPLAHVMSPALFLKRLFKSDK